MNVNDLRFAPIIRVSTEKQADKGESLRTQKKQIQHYVKALNGQIPESCWMYSGQEHATPNQERTKLEMLLTDSSKNKFDCVIVCDTSRWSRDNLKSKEGLAILRDNKIKFFVGTMEYDLHNPEHNFILGMSAEVGELQAKQQSLKSTMNRIERAKRGIPSSGRLPYGRLFDKKNNVWSLDKEKTKKIQIAAQQYLDGNSMMNIAKSLDMNHSNLWKILTKRSSSNWEIKFNVESLNINETIKFKIPPLLDDKTIEKIYEQGQINKTYSRGQQKYFYLVGNFIFCKECGYALAGQTNQSGKRYYRHYRHRKKDCSIKNWIPADLIENAVLLHLFNMFGDVKRIQNAIEKATPDLEKMKQKISELEILKKNKRNVLKQRENLVSLAGKGLLSDNEIEKRITVIRSNLATINERSNLLESYLDNTQSLKDIKKKSTMAFCIMKSVMQSGAALSKMDNKSKRELIKHAFSGNNSEGKRLGVYIGQTGHEIRPWSFEIKAILEPIISSVLPMYKAQVEELLGIDEYADLKEVLKEYNINSSNFALPCQSKRYTASYFNINGMI